MTTTRTQAWTYETLAAADRKQLEEVMLTCPAPDLDELEGYIYCGWNHEWIGRISGEKFKKGFRRREGRPFGYNEIVQPGRPGLPRRLGGEAEGRPPDPARLLPRLAGGRRAAAAALRAVPARRALQLRRAAQHLEEPAVPRDPRLRRAAEPGRPRLMLCKAYLQFGFKWANVFYCYFLLGHREEIEFEPW